MSRKKHKDHPTETFTRRIYATEVDGNNVDVAWCIIVSKEKFLKVYANLPVPERSQVIAIIDGKTYSWDAAYNEIDANTELGKTILKKIKALGIL